MVPKSAVAGVSAAGLEGLCVGKPNKLFPPDGGLKLDADCEKTLLVELCSALAVAFVPGPLVALDGCEFPKPKLLAGGVKLEVG